MFVLAHIADALRMGGSMFWQVLWPLTLGFLLSAVAETLAPARRVSRLLGAPSPRAIALATVLGAVSSSCSYAAVALARSLVRKGASLVAAIAFEFASTNLVFELGLALVVILGWQFLGAEVAGGLLMIAIVALLMRMTLPARLEREAADQAARGRRGRMEGHAAMDMSVAGGPLLRRAFSADSLTAISHNFYMSVAGVAADLLIGFVVAGALAAWVPAAVWSAVFLTGHGALSEVWGVIVAPLLAVVSFVCSVGNVPLAAVLWRGGVSFGGAIAFLFGDLIILPIVDMHRRYYGARTALYLFAVSLVAMALAGLVVDVIAHALGAVPRSRAVSALVAPVTLDGVAVVNIVFIAIAAGLGVRFLRTGGIAMLRAMNGGAADPIT